VFRDPKSPFWVGSYYAWNAAEKRWQRVRKTTECDEESAALAVAKEWQRVAELVGDANGSRMTRESVLASLNFILRLGGVPDVEESKPWNVYSQAWLDLFKTSRARPDSDEVDRSWEAYKSHFKTFTKWLDEDAGWDLRRFDGMVLQEFYDDLMEDGRTPGTCKNILKSVGRVFERAIHEGFCTRNPVELVVRRDWEDGEHKKEPFSQSDLVLIERHLRHRASRDPVMADWLTMHYLGICTGRRLEDCARAGLQHFEKDPELGLEVWRLKVRKLRRKGRVERIPIVEPLASHLKQLRKDARGLYLCPHLAGREKLSEEFGAILKAAGVQVKVVEALGDAGHDRSTKGYHSYRHTVSTLMLSAGVNKRIAMKAVGHSTEQVHDGYAHGELKVIAEALGSVSGKR
jgi:integrase